MKRILGAILLLFATSVGAQQFQAPFIPGVVSAGTNTNNQAVTTGAAVLNCDVTGAPGTYPAYLINVIGTQTVFVNVGSVSAPPASATTSNQPLPAGSIQTFSWPFNARVSVVAAGTGSTFYCTAGSGS